MKILGVLHVLHIHCFWSLISFGNVGHFKDDFYRSTQGNKLSEKYSDVKAIEVLLSINDLHLKSR